MRAKPVPPRAAFIVLEHDEDRDNQDSRLRSPLYTKEGAEIITLNKSQLMAPICVSVIN